jgi:hypothetical protein
MKIIKKILAYSFFIVSLLILLLLSAANIWLFFEKRTTSIDFEGNRYTVTDEDYVLFDSIRIFLPKISLILGSSEENTDNARGISFFTDNFNVIIVSINDGWDIAFTEDYFRRYPLSSIYRDILPIYTIYKYKDDNIYIEYAGGDDSGKQTGVSFLTDIYIPGRNIYMTVVGTEYDFEDIKEYVAKVIYNTDSSEFKVDEEKIWQLKN